VEKGRTVGVEIGMAVAVAVVKYIKEGAERRSNVLEGEARVEEGKEG
jgi:hypothetical protein